MDIYQAIKELYRGCIVTTSKSTGGYWFVRDGIIHCHIPGEGDKPDEYLLTSTFINCTDFVSDTLAEHDFNHDIGWAMDQVKAGRCAARKAWKDVSEDYITLQTVAKNVKSEDKKWKIGKRLVGKSLTIDWAPEGIDLVAKDWGW